jgi:hypothetical protein
MAAPAPPSATSADHKTTGAPVVMDAEKKTAGSFHGSLSSDEPAPRLHAKTFLAVFAVCLIYFAQLVSLVGAGAVSPQRIPPSKTATCPPRSH